MCGGGGMYVCVGADISLYIVFLFAIDFVPFFFIIFLI